MDAQKMPDPIGQVIRVNPDWVEVIWENGRWAEYSHIAFWRGEARYLEKVVE